jgi:hypothetical protein
MRAAKLKAPRVSSQSFRRGDKKKEFPVVIERGKTALPEHIKHLGGSNLGRFAFSCPRFPSWKVLPTCFGLLEVINNTRIAAVDFRQDKNRVPRWLGGQIKRI